MSESRRPSRAAAGVVVVLLISLLISISQSSFDVYVLDNVLLACMGSIALGLLVGTAGQISLGNAAFLLAGGFSTVFLGHVGIPFPLDVFLAGLFTAACGLLVGIPALRLRSLFLALATLAALFIGTYFGNQYQGRDPNTASSGIPVRVIFGSFSLRQEGRLWAWTLAGLVSVLIIGAYRVTRSKTGRALRMIRDHEVAAATLGISVPKYKLAAFTLSALVVGVEGSLQAHFGGSVTVDYYTLLLSVQYVSMVYVGGRDSIAGWVVGAAIISALPSVVPRITSHFMSQARSAVDGPNIAQILYGFLIVLFVVVSPDGIVGAVRRLGRQRGDVFRRLLTAPFRVSHLGADGECRKDKYRYRWRPRSGLKR